MGVAGDSLHNQVPGLDCFGRRPRQRRLYPEGEARSAASTRAFQARLGPHRNRPLHTGIITTRPSVRTELLGQEFAGGIPQRNGFGLEALVKPLKLRATASSSSIMPENVALLKSGLRSNGLESRLQA